MPVQVQSFPKWEMIPPRHPLRISSSHGEQQELQECGYTAASPTTSRAPNILHATGIECAPVASRGRGVCRVPKAPAQARRMPLSRPS